MAMAATPFPCNGILPIQGNLPMVLPVLILKFASCLIDASTKCRQLCMYDQRLDRQLLKILNNVI